MFEKNRADNELKLHETGDKSVLGFCYFKIVHMGMGTVDGGIGKNGNVNKVLSWERVGMGM